MDRFLVSCRWYHSFVKIAICFHWQFSCSKRGRAGDEEERGRKTAREDRILDQFCIYSLHTYISACRDQWSTVPSSSFDCQGQILTNQVNGAESQQVKAHVLN